MRDVPDSLEGDHAASDPIWADLHDVYLACDPVRLVMGTVEMCRRERCLLKDTDACAIAKFRDGLWRSQHEYYTVKW